MTGRNVSWPFFDLSKVPVQLDIDRDTADPAAAVIAKGARHVTVRQWHAGVLEALVPAAGNIERLTIDKGAADLAGLPCFRNLTHLTMRDGAHTIPFAQVPQLEKLHIWADNPTFGDIGAAVGLRELHIICDGLKDLAPIVAPRNLQELRISESPLRAVTGIGRFASLRDVSLTQLPLDDIGPLAELPDLERVHLMDLPRLSAIEGLRPLTRLKWLGLNNLRKVKDVSVVGNLHALEHLSLSGFPLGDAMFLEGLAKLRILLINRGGSVPSFRFVRSLPKLESLSLENTIAEDGDLSAMIDHPSLRAVYFENKRHYSVKLAEVNKILEARRQSTA